MNSRRPGGSALAFVAAATLVLIMIGAFFFLLSMQMGGSRELLHATDAGSLNVAKQAIRKPDVPLSPSEEKENFGGLIDKGEVSLANYNRIVGQTLLVALNAQAEGTAASKANAEKLIDLVHGSNGIGAKLTSALKDANKMGSHFTAVSLVNSVRMLGTSAEADADEDKHEVAYLEEGSASNVDFHPETLPFDEHMTRAKLPGGALASEKSKKNLSYIAGYMPIKLNGISKSLSGVPVMPGKAPHLVSLKDFNGKRVEPQGTSVVPPNAFKSGGSAATSKGIACSIVGALDTSFTASIPNGYIIIKNGGSANFQGQLGGNDHIFAQELNTGIYVGPGNGTNRAFTTDAKLYGQWLDYNNAVKNGVSPLPPAPSRVGMHGADPTTITSLEDEVDWTRYAEPDDTAKAMLPLFAAAYPHANPTTAFSSSELTAVEKWKAKVIEGFGKVSRLHDPTDPAFRQNIPAPTEVTGMKAYNMSGGYSSPPGPIAFGRAGSLREFLTQCNASNVLTHITQRMHQIKPEASDAEIQSVLNTPCIGMASTFYIYKANNKLTIGSNKPGAVYSSPDGAPFDVKKTQRTYDLNKVFINVSKDGGAPVNPFGYGPDAKGTDRCIYTPSSGYRNLLGILEFSNSTSVGEPPSQPGTPSGSDAWFWDPN